MHATQTCQGKFTKETGGLGESSIEGGNVKVAAHPLHCPGSVAWAMPCSLSGLRYILQQQTESRPITVGWICGPKQEACAGRQRSRAGKDHAGDRPAPGQLRITKAVNVSRKPCITSCDIVRSRAGQYHMSPTNIGQWQPQGMLPHIEVRLESL